MQSGITKYKVKGSNFYQDLSDLISDNDLSIYDCIYDKKSDMLFMVLSTDVCQSAIRVLALPDKNVVNLDLYKKKRYCSCYKRYI